MVREVANSTEEFRPFLGKPQPGPDAFLAAPSRGWLPHRGAPWVPPGAEPDQPPASRRAESGSSCKHEGYQDGAPQPGLALMAASHSPGTLLLEQPHGQGSGSTQSDRQDVSPGCVQAAPSSSVTSRGHFKATMLSATLCFRCPRASSTDSGSEVGSAGKGLC